MNEIDNILAREWRQLSDNIDRIDPDKTKQNMHNVNLRRQTALQRLAIRYRRFSIMALCCTPMAMAFLNSSVFTGPNRVYIFLFYIIVMLSAAAYDWWLYRKISSISVAEMPVIEVLHKAWMCRKRHLQFIAYFLPVDILFIGMMFTLSDGSISFLCGIIAGTVVGLIIGLKNLRRFMADYREIFESND